MVGIVSLISLLLVGIFKESPAFMTVYKGEHDPRTIPRYLPIMESCEQSLGYFIIYRPQTVILVKIEAQ